MLDLKGLRYVNVRVAKTPVRDANPNPRVVNDDDEIKQAIKRYNSHPVEGMDPSVYLVLRAGLEPNSERDLVKLSLAVSNLIYGGNLDPELDCIWIKVGQFRKSAGVLAVAAHNLGFNGYVDSKKDGIVTLEEYCTILTEE